MYCVFFIKFTAILLALNQTPSFCSSEFMKLIRSLKFLCSARHVVSPENKYVAKSVALKISLI